MKSHHVVDVLRGRSSEFSIMMPDMPPQMRQKFTEWTNLAGDVIADSHHFVFENIPIEVDGNGVVTMPGLTEEEWEMFSSGLIPLPFEQCWFEAPVYNDGNSAPVWTSETMAWHLAEAHNRGIVITPFSISNTRNGRFVTVTGEQWLIPPAAPGSAQLEIKYVDEYGAAELLEEISKDTGVDLTFRDMIGGGVGLVLYLLLMLSSKTTEVFQHEAPHKLNRKRQAKGRAPLPAHRTVSIIPRGAVREYRAQEREMLEKGSRASPRIHWRRSHVRTLGDGRKVVVARSLVGYRKDPTREFVSHSYRVHSGA